jgi:peptidoglycan/xylan/chitin deacetylase (PgdA/CDA1 family)
MITHFSGNEKKIYLTFDDGPTPEITNQVLAFLLKYNAKATFFCCGKRVQNNPDLYSKIIEEGHVTGNHGYSHLHGWHTNTESYIADCHKASELIKSPFFRPPYGKLRMSQYKALKSHFTLYLWTALSWDFHPWVSPQRCLKIALKALKPGVIIVFHDTPKAADKLLYTLPKILETGIEQGYQFVSIPLE